LKKITLIFFIFFSSSAGAKSEEWRGLHTYSRVLVPSDSEQNVNYILPAKNKKKPKINAPLVTTETFVDPERKFKYLKLVEQAILSEQSGQQEQ